MVVNATPRPGVMAGACLETGVEDRALAVVVEVGLEDVLHALGRGDAEDARPEQTLPRCATKPRSVSRGMERARMSDTLRGLVDCRPARLERPVVMPCPQCRHGAHLEGPGLALELARVLEEPVEEPLPPQVHLDGLVDQRVREGARHASPGESQSVPHQRQDKAHADGWQEHSASGATPCVCVGIRGTGLTHHHRLPLAGHQVEQGLQRCLEAQHWAVSRARRRKDNSRVLG
jgi:hypothetical protein